jgi:cytosine/adenosine deaminase-related metal-dependent hydrolase
MSAGKTDMPTPTALHDILQRQNYTLAPEVILLKAGPERHHFITVENGLITKVGPLDQYDGDYLALPGIAVIPGFIDAHTHVGQTFGKALIGGEPAQIWKRIWNPMEAALTVEGAYLSAKWMFLEAMRGGYTSLVNFTMNGSDLNAAVHRAAAETGIRLVSSSGADEYLNDDSGNRVIRSEADITTIIDRHIDDCKAFPSIVPSICSTSFFGNSLGGLKRLADLCRDRAIKLQIHSNEHFPEVHECVTRFGKRPIELLDQIGALGDHLLLHHATLVTDREIELLAESSTPISYNPVASMWKGNSVAPALAFSERGVNFGIGTDTTTADGFKTICAAETCQRLRYSMAVDDFSSGSAWTWTDAASSGSAKAAGIDGVTGQLAVGLAADFMLLDMIRPECLPSHDFEWELVRYYNRDQVISVIVAGKLTMWQGHAAGWDDEEFVAANLDLAEKISSVPTIHRVHGTSGKRRPKIN